MRTRLRVMAKTVENILCRVLGLRLNFVGVYRLWRAHECFWLWTDLSTLRNLHLRNFQGSISRQPDACVTFHCAQNVYPGIGSVFYITFCASAAIQVSDMKVSVR